MTWPPYLAFGFCTLLRWRLWIFLRDFQRRSCSTWSLGAFLGLFLQFWGAFFKLSGSLLREFFVTMVYSTWETSSRHNKSEIGRPKHLAWLVHIREFFILSCPGACCLRQVSIICSRFEISFTHKYQFSFPASPNRVIREFYQRQRQKTMIWLRHAP